MADSEKEPTKRWIICLVKPGSRRRWSLVTLSLPPSLHHRWLPSLVCQGSWFVISGYHDPALGCTSLFPVVVSRSWNYTSLLTNHHEPAFKPRLPREGILNRLCLIILTYSSILCNPASETYATKCMPVIKNTCQSYDFHRSSGCVIDKGYGCDDDVVIAYSAWQNSYMILFILLLIQLLNKYDYISIVI